MDQIVTVGRRKRAVARVFLKAGVGNININKKQYNEYFPVGTDQAKVLEPFAVLELNQGEYDIKVNVDGGGRTGQADAVRMAISRALVDVNEEFRSPLKKAGLLTRDAREVERKKPGRRKARKVKQFSKR